MMKLAIGLLTCALLAGWNANRAFAISVPLTDDTYTSDRDGGGPFGSSIQLRSKNESGGNRRMSFLQFDLTSISAVTDATFSLTPIFTNLGDNPMGSAEFEVLGSVAKIWDEDTLIEGGIANGDSDLLTNSTSLGTFNLTDDGTVTPGVVNFTSAALTTFLHGNVGGPVTLIVQRNSFNGGSYVHAFSSKEGANSPELNVTVPEPATLTLATIGLLGLAVQRWRRR